MAKLYQSKAWLVARRAEGKSPEDIGALLKVSHMTIRRWMEKLGVK